MSRLAEFRLLEQQLAAQLAELEALKNDSALKQEMEFETKLRSLLNEYGYGLRQVVLILDPQAMVSADVAPQNTRKPREMKVYKNPHSGEVVETKGGNQKTLKAWKNEYGAEVVESWLTK
ncbi:MULTISPECIES: histone-like nucleoid-structuring protein, MvaT/MvaU family [Pseudomonas]|uniref:histone-like nucleoid-structuring protein, MvaT/MvaU family n=1 Tax=Pseudomonas TaxID=286 RepID=UPI0010C06B38|nr:MULTISPECIES: histone-like nucleoid-structuring protein, MvaT/MvaU family [Pseudomonas]